MPRPPSRAPAEPERLIHEHCREAARQPTETPRKQAISTMFVKNVRKITVLPNQRMHASSKNRIKKLIRNSSMPAARRTLAWVIGRAWRSQKLGEANSADTNPHRCQLAHRSVS